MKSAEYSEDNVSQSEEKLDLGHLNINVTEISQISNDFSQISINSLNSINSINSINSNKANYNNSSPKIFSSSSGGGKKMKNEHENYKTDGSEDRSNLKKLKMKKNEGVDHQQHQTMESGKEQNKVDKELVLIRQLLSAEVTADACEMIDAQNSLLNSSFSEGINFDEHEIKNPKNVNFEKIQEVKKKLGKVENKIKTPSAAAMFEFSEDFNSAVTQNVEKVSESLSPKKGFFKSLTRNSARVTLNGADDFEVKMTSFESSFNDGKSDKKGKKTSKSKNNAVKTIHLKNPNAYTVKLPVKNIAQNLDENEDDEENFIEAEIDQKLGLDDGLIQLFFNTFEESELVNLMLEKLDMDSFSTLLENDTLFKEEFKWWCKAFLRSRRYRINRALETLKNYAAWRQSCFFFKDSTAGLGKCDDELTITGYDDNSGSEKDSIPDPIEDHKRHLRRKVKEHLETGFVLYLEDAKCKDSRGLIVFRLALHDSSKFAEDILLLSLHSVFLHALKSDPIIQAKGFTIILDMSRCKSKNVYMKAAEVITNSLTETLPVRYGKLIVYNPPIYFNAMFKWINLSIFTSTKIKDRLVTVFPKKKEGFKIETRGFFKYIEKDQLPSFYGGKQQISTLKFAEDVLWSATSS